MNINRLLENAVRTDLIGHNMVSGGRDYEPDPPSARQREASPYALHWDRPQMGLQGQLTLGHHLNIRATVSFCMRDAASGLPFHWYPTRHRWIPAWADTYYISQIEETDYPDAGTLLVHEKKCILMDSDVFISKLTLTNLRRESRRIDIRVTSPLIPDDSDHAGIHAAMLPGALGQTLYLSGHVVLCAEYDEQPGICELQPFAQTTFSVQ